MTDTAWMRLAACKNQTDLFFPDEREAQAKYQQARRICHTCPARLVCLEWAIEHEEWKGMWGGLTPNERAKLASRNGRAFTGVRTCEQCGADFKVGPGWKLGRFCSQKCKTAEYRESHRQAQRRYRQRQKWVS